MYKAIFLDLDGTLLDDDKNVSQENRKAIDMAESIGVSVCLCSGRQKEFVKKIKEKAGINSQYVISSNGCEIYDLKNKEVLFTANLENSLSKNLYEYCENKGHLIRIDTIYGRFLNNMKYEYSGELEFSENIDKFLSENNVIQISVCTKTEHEIDEAINYIKSLGADIKIENRYKTGNRDWSLWAINIINKNASKGNAIYGLCKYLKIDIKDVIAMGDDLNDISMIKEAGLGVAMGNATPKVKQVADEITKTNNENGVAEIINSKILCL